MTLLGITSNIKKTLRFGNSNSLVMTDNLLMVTYLILLCLQINSPNLGITDPQPSTSKDRSDCDSTVSLNTGVTQLLKAISIKKKNTDVIVRSPSEHSSGSSISSRSSDSSDSSDSDSSKGSDSPREQRRKKFEEENREQLEKAARIQQKRWDDLVEKNNRLASNVQESTVDNVGYSSK